MTWAGKRYFWLVGLLAGYWNYLEQIEGLMTRLGDLGTRPPSPADPKVRRARQIGADAVDALVWAYKSGDSVPELAGKFGINETTVRAHLVRREISTRGNGGYRKLHGEQLGRAQALYAAGQSLRSVAAELRLSREAVRSGLVMAGVVLRAR